MELSFVKAAIMFQDSMHTSSGVRSSRMLAALANCLSSGESLMCRYAYFTISNWIFLPNLRRHLHMNRYPNFIIISQQFIVYGT